MSDPVTNVESTDLLDSVRRLVADAPSAQTEPAPAAGRLVLTPSLRVDDAVTDETRPDSAEHAADFIAPQPTAQADPEPVTAAHFLPETDEVSASADVLTLAPEDAVADDDAAIDEIADAPDDVQVDVADEDGEPDIHTPEVDLEQAPDVEDTPDADELDPAAEFFDSHQDRHARLEATIAELEDAVLHQGDEFEPDGSETQVELQDWEDAAPIEESARATDIPSWEPVDHDAPDQAVSDNAHSDLEDMGLPTGDWDEDALRDLISEVLREELRGQVGERITRNVRKLIRREIYRVLTTEGMDG